MKSLLNKMKEEFRQGRYGPLYIGDLVKCTTNGGYIYKIIEFKNENTLVIKPVLYINGEQCGSIDTHSNNHPKTFYK